MLRQVLQITHSHINWTIICLACKETVEEVVGIGPIMQHVSVSHTVIVAHYADM